MNDASIVHTRWNCQYHIVFIPKYRKKVIFKGVRKDLGQILRKLCEIKEVTIIAAATQSDHVHMLVSIPPKLSVSEVMGYLKGKSTLMLYDRHPELVQKGMRRSPLKGQPVKDGAWQKILCRRFSTNVKNGAVKQGGFWLNPLRCIAPGSAPRYARRRRECRGVLPGILGAEGSARGAFGEHQCELAEHQVPILTPGMPVLHDPLRRQV